MRKINTRARTFGFQKTKMLAAAAGAAVGLLSSWSARAANTLYFNPASSPGTWDNTVTSDWNTASNGTSSSNQLWNSGSIAFFNDTAFATTPYTVNVNDTVTALGIIFGNHAGTIDAPSAQTLTIGSSGVTVNSGATGTFGASSSTNLSLAIAGGGITTFTNSGNGLTVNSPISLGSSSGTGTLTIDGTVTYNGVISNGSGGGTLAMSISLGGTAILNNANTNTGSTTLTTGGTLTLENANALQDSNLNLGTGTVNLVSATGATFTDASLQAQNTVFVATGGTGVTQTIGGTYNTPTGGTTAYFQNTNGDNLAIGTLNDNGSNQSLTNDMTGGGILSIAVLANNGVSSNNHTMTLTGPGTWSVGQIENSTNGVANTLAFTMSGTGTVVLTGSSSYTGTTAINSGTLELSGAAALGATALTANAGAALAVAQTASSTSNIITSSNLVLGSGSTFTMHDGFTSTANVTGTANIKAATLVFDIGGTTTAADQLVAAGAITDGSAGGQIQIDGIGSTSLTTGTYTLIQGGSGSALTTNELTLGSTKVYVNGTPYALSLSYNAGSVQLNVAAFTGTDQAYWNGSDASDWGVTGFNTSATSGTNISSAISSGTDVFFSTTTPTPASSTSTIAAPVTINSLNYLSTAASVALGGSTLTINDGGINDASTSAQTITAPIVLGAAQTWSNTGNALLTIGTASGGTLTANANQLSVTTTAGGGNIQINQPIISTAGVGLSVGGTGTTTLYQTSNTYTGLTLVSSGTLALTGASGSGSINVLGGTSITVGGGAANATLQINGNVGLGTTSAGTVSLAGGNGTTIGRGILSLVDGTINTLTLNKTSGNVLTIGGPLGYPSVLDFELGSTGSDEIVVASPGDLAINAGGALINITTLSTAPNGVYTLISDQAITSPTTASSFSSLVFSNGTLTERVGSQTYALGDVADGTGYNETLTVTPEPTSLGLLCLGGLMTRRCRRRARSPRP